MSEDEISIHTHILEVDGIVRCIVITCDTDFEWSYATEEQGIDDVF